MSFPETGDINSTGMVYVQAPHGLTESTINGVWIYPNEVVEWNWTYGPGISHVSGYTIKKRIPGS